MTWRVLFISWEPPPAIFVKVNFDGNIRGAKGDVGYVIKDPKDRLLATGGSILFEPFVLEVKLRVTWMDIIYVR